MRVVLGTHHLIAPAGADTYLVTVAHQLQRLGHEVVIHALEQGELADRAREQGLPVAAVERELPAECDAVLCQDRVTAYDLAARYPAAPHVFVSHSDVFSIDEPPVVPEAVRAVVAMSDRVRRHLEAQPLEAEIVRLHQPIDLAHFAPSGLARETARRVVAVSNYLEGPRLDLLREACAAEGLELELYGSAGTVVADPRPAIGEADVVVGKGRVVLEAMACARAALVYDFMGFGGWITPESYPVLEADAFAGQADPLPADVAHLREALRGYSSQMGVANRDLVQAHHDAADHARSLVELLERLAGGPAPAADGVALRQLALMAQRLWLAEAGLSDARRRISDLEGRLGHEHDRSDKAEELARQAVAALDEVKSSRRYRIAQRLARLRPGGGPSAGSKKTH
jgi:hypothetical protein